MDGPTATSPTPPTVVATTSTIAGTPSPTQPTPLLNRVGDPEPIPMDRTVPAMQHNHPQGQQETIFIAAFAGSRMRTLLPQWIAACARKLFAHHVHRQHCAFSSNRIALVRYFLHALNVCILDTKQAQLRTSGMHKCSANSLRT